MMQLKSLVGRREGTPVILGGLGHRSKGGTLGSELQERGERETVGEAMDS